MHEIILKTTIDECIVSAWKYNVGEVNVRSLLVELCAEMLNCDMSFVTFKLADGTEYESKVKDGKAEMPPINEPQLIEVGAYSSNVEGDKCVKRYSPRPVNVYVNYGSYSSNGTEPPIPTSGTYAELVEMINGISGGMATITKETFINELPSGIYRCKAENNVTLYFDTNTEYGLVDGFAIITHLEGGKYQWFAIGVGYPDWEECARLGVSVVDAKGNVGVESIKDLNTIVTAEEIQKNIGEPVTKHITTLYGEVRKKENVSNKTNEIDRNSTDEQYASAKAVYQYCELVWQAHQIDVNEKLEDLKNKIGGEWKLITDITIPEENASVTLFVDKDSEGNPFSCTEIDIVWKGIKVTDDTTSGKAWISLNPTRAGYNTGKCGMATQNYFYYTSNANYINGHSIRLSRGNLTQTGQNWFNTDFLKDFPNEITSIEVSGYQQKSFYGRVIIYGR